MRPHFQAVIAILLAAGPWVHAGGDVRVEEAGLRLEVQAEGALLTVPVHNDGPAGLAGRLQVEVLAPDEAVRAEAEVAVQLVPGRSELRLVLPPRLGEPEGTPQSRLVLSRLRYALTTDGAVVAGVRAVSSALQGQFRLRVTSNMAARAGRGTLLRVTATDPATGAAVPGVALRAGLRDVAEGPVALGTSDQNGEALLRLELPGQPWRGEQVVEVEGRHAGTVEKLTVTKWLGQTVQALVTTDKPLYRPGQSLRGRVLVLDPGQRVLSGLSLRVRVEGPQGEAVFQAAPVTSAHGTASFDWPIPARAALGQYAVRVEASAQEDQELARAEVSVGQYELPVFRFEARAGSPYYLAGQAAQVEVQAQSLTGEPLPGAQVRVVRNDDEDRVVRARTDASGRARVTLDLKRDHEELADGWGQPFADVGFQASVTDPISGRSESRRFDVRVTREPIHVYFQARERWPSGTVGLPLQGYVAAYYADGRPCVCVLTLSGPIEGRVETDRNGLARVSGRAPLRPHTDSDSDDLLIDARDAQGHAGHHRESLYVSDEPAVRVEPERALLRTGEPVRVRLTAVPAARVLMQLWHAEALVAERRVEASPEGVPVEFPWEPALQGAVSITALRLDRRDASANRGLLYPDGRALKLQVEAAPARARPGAMVEARLRLTDGKGAGTPGAIGLVGVDVALLERARAEQEFGGFWYETGLPWDTDCRAGTRLSDLESLESSGPWSEEQQLVAELLLDTGQVWLDQQESPYPDASQVSRLAIQRSLDPLRTALARFVRERGGPEGLEALVQAGGTSELRLDGVSDPWGTPLRWKLTPERAVLRLSAASAGPDEASETSDDFELSVDSWSWFERAQDGMRRALVRYVERTERVPRRLEELSPDLRGEGLDLQALRDPWGAPLRYGIEVRGRYAEIWAQSRGAGPQPAWFEAGRARVELFARAARGVTSALDAWVQLHQRLPRDQAELRAAGVSPGELRDPWGRGCRARMRQEARFADRVRAVGSEAAGGPAQVAVTPVTELQDVLEIVSAGPDGKADTRDDAPLVTFRRVSGESATTDITGFVKARPREPVVSDTRGALAGLVTDAEGLPLPGVTVVARQGGRDVAQGTSDANGGYVLGGLVPGRYSLRFELSGFLALELESLEVLAGRRTSADARLRIGGMLEEITVSAEAPQVQTNSSAIASRVSAVAKPTFTPRLREYFPETLVWQPELETDAEGRTVVRFPLADSLTTWRLRALGSTQDGRVATAEGDVVGFQPFFAELDPPPFLTSGDRLSLPVPVRNLLERGQQVALALERDEALGGGTSTATLSVAPGAVAVSTFELTAAHPARAAMLTATATGETEGDRIRKPLEVRPNGEPVVATRAEVIQGDARLELLVPGDSLPGSSWAELRVLPDLRSQVAQAVEGALQRPWGCGEQTVSAAFPSLLLLELQGPGGPLGERARKYLEQGVQRLEAYESPNGGFGYWGPAPVDVSLTAHALRLLERAARFVTVDPKRLLGAREALLRTQAADGGWSGRQGEGGRSDPQVTAQVARALAESDPRDEKLDGALRRAFALLSAQVERLDEPYVIATYALLAERVSEREQARAALGRLRRLEHALGDTVFWDLQTNTPFYGWGAAGRVETTGLALQVLERLADDEPARQAADRALLFLLRRQDRYGVWWSSQATVNVLEALVARIAHEPPSAAPSGEVTVWLDGQRRGALDWPAGTSGSPPLVFDLGANLAPGPHTVELRGAPEGSSSLQLVSGYARAWPTAPQAPPGLRFAVSYDRRVLRRGEWVNVQVQAERVGFRGYGMMLAEVGLPPGADVDRAGLERALGSVPGLWRYELQPDRVVLYLWPTAGGVRASFRFRPRLAMEALSAPGQLYDYYNPEERVLQPPTRFIVE